MVVRDLCLVFETYGLSLGLLTTVFFCTSLENTVNMLQINMHVKLYINITQADRTLKFSFQKV